MLPAIDALIVSSEPEMEALQKRWASAWLPVLPVGNVLRSRAELEAVWLKASDQPMPQLPPPCPPLAASALRVPYSPVPLWLACQRQGAEILLGALQEIRRLGCKPCCAWVVISRRAISRPSSCWS